MASCLPAYQKNVNKSLAKKYRAGELPFFNIKPVYRRWAGRGYWTSEQAAALLNDIEPDEKFTPQYFLNKAENRIKELQRIYPRAVPFVECYQIICSDTSLTQKLSPEGWIKWGKAKDYQTSDELINAVRQYSSRQDPATTQALLTKESQAVLPSQGMTISTRNKETLLWIVGVCLHKAFKSDFLENTKGYTVAEKLMNYAESNGIESKSKNAIRGTVIDAMHEVIGEAQTLMTKGNDKKSES